MNKFKYLILSLAILTTASVLTIGCGDDSVAPPNNGGGTGTTPNINMKLNSIYSFTNDSLDTNGSVRRTRIKTTTAYSSQGTYFDTANAFRTISISIDTVTSTTISQDTNWVYYNGTTGKFYQYGLVKLIDSTQSPKWDLVADFSVAQGTQWTVTSFNTTINGISVSITIKGKVAEQTSFSTTSNPSQTINCYRVELSADVTAFSIPAGTIYVDYYIGYANPASNPSGLVRLKLRPIKLSALGIPIFASPGVDQVLQTYVIP